MQDGNQTLLRNADHKLCLRFIEDDLRIEFVAADNPRRLFMTTKVEMYVDGKLWDSQESWTCDYRFALPAEASSTGRDVDYAFGYNAGNAFSLGWRRFEDGSYQTGGALPVSNAGTTLACLGAMTLWAIVWYSWLLPTLFASIFAWLGY